MLSMMQNLYLAGERSFHSSVILDDFSWLVGWITIGGGPMPKLKIRNNEDSE
jgi:hypothetical protein